MRRQRPGALRPVDDFRIRSKSLLTRPWRWAEITTAPEEFPSYGAAELRSDQLRLGLARAIPSMQPYPADTQQSLESQEVHRIIEQLRRLKHLGCPGWPKTPEAAREHVAGLLSMPPDLLELAVSRWIETSASRFFPFPGELRALVQDELRQRASELYDGRHQLLLEELRAKGITVIEAGS